MSYCPLGSIQSSPCPAGSVCINPSSIRNCTSGSYCPQNSSIELQCISGSYCPASSSEQRPCPVGSVCTTPSSMGYCGIGSYCPASSTVELRCAFGFYCPNGTVQLPCPVGYFCDSGSTVPFFYVDEGCAPPMIYLPFSSDLTENLGYETKQISVYGSSCVIQPNVCYIVRNPCMSALKCGGSTSSYIGFPVYIDSSFSVTMWMYLESFYGPLFSLDYGVVSGGTSFSLEISGNYVRVTMYLNTISSTSALYYFSERVWTHVAVSVECRNAACTVNVYLNGLILKSFTKPGSALLKNLVARIVSDRSSLYGFNGVVAQFGLFNYAISAQQVYSIFKGNPTSCKCPIGFYCETTALPPTKCPPGASFL